MSLEETVLGHYRLLELIGSGGMGEVYLAEDTRIARRVAVKVVRGELDLYTNTLASQDAARLFQREMKAIAALDHPNILPLIDFGEKIVNHSIRTYLVMPYRPEGSFANWLQTHGGTPQPQEVVLPLIRQAAEALQHAHDHQILHLDVKTPNFLVRAPQGNAQRPDILLTDFGIARISTATSTVSQSVRGTPYSMAPEQWMGRPVTASDQYSLAIMAYQLLTGVVPFQGNLHQMMYKHLQASPLAPSMHNPLIPAFADAVLLRALAKNPEDRFPSIQAFAMALQNAWDDSSPIMYTPPASLSQNENQDYIPTAIMTPVSLSQDKAQDYIPTTYTTPASALPHVSSPKMPTQTPPSAQVAGRFFAVLHGLINRAPTAPQKNDLHSSTRPASKRGRSSLILTITLILVFIFGGIFSFVFFFTANNISTPRGTPSLKSSSQTSGNSSSPTSVPIPNINYGHLLYTTTAPSSHCDKGGGQWGDYNNPGIQCSTAGTTISNLNSTSPDLVGTILKTLPDGPYPNDYVIETQVQQPNTSSDFGIYFRNQPGTQLGTYTFFIHPNGSWSVYSYDNISGAQAQITFGTTSIDPHALLRITIIVTGAKFTFYINGQQVGNISNITYKTGTTGIAVDSGGTLLVKSFNLYAIA